MLLAFALTASQICGSMNASSVNRPLSSAEISTHATSERIRRTIAKFADRDHFAVQATAPQSQGMIDLSARLFRDDISVIVTRLKDGPIRVTAYPLCICELGCRAGLQEAADAAVADLKDQLSQ